MENDLFSRVRSEPDAAFNGLLFEVIAQTRAENLSEIIGLCLNKSEQP